jgi:hypothetical protein
MTRARVRALADLKRSVNKAINQANQDERERLRLKAVRQTPRSDRPRCGAKTRRGTVCIRLPVWEKARNRPRNGRCPNHGGLSTGPVTPEGKARCIAGTRQAWVRRRAETAVLLTLATMLVLIVAGLT